MSYLAADRIAHMTAEQLFRWIQIEKKHPSGHLEALEAQFMQIANPDDVNGLLEILGKEPTFENAVRYIYWDYPKVQKNKVFSPVKPAVSLEECDAEIELKHRTVKAKRVGPIDEVGMRPSALKMEPKYFINPLLSPIKLSATPSPSSFSSESPRRSPSPSPFLRNFQKSAHRPDSLFTVNPCLASMGCDAYGNTYPSGYYSPVR